jgi:hypothetical protein
MRMGWLLVACMKGDFYLFVLHFGTAKFVPVGWVGGEIMTTWVFGWVLGEVHGNPLDSPYMYNNLIIRVASLLGAWLSTGNIIYTIF